MITILVLLMGVLAVTLAGYASWRMGIAERDALESRTALDAAVDPGRERLIKALDGRIRRTRGGRWMQRRLTRAGMTWRVVDAWAALVAIALAGFVIADRYVTWWVALLVGAGLARAALFYLDRRERQRREAFIAQLPQLARVLSNATSAGLSLRAAVRLAADDLAAPAGPELHHLSERLAVGTSVVDALGEMQDRLPSRELSLLTRTLVIQSRAGGAVVTALRDMSETLEARKELRREIRTLLAGAVYTTWVVLVIGIGAVLALNGIAPGTLNRMTSTFLGQAALVFAATFFALGLLLIRRTTRIEV
jgi:tight adherence protein B